MRFGFHAVNLGPLATLESIHKIVTTAERHDIDSIWTGSKTGICIPTHVFEGLRHAIATGELATGSLLTALGLTFVLLFVSLFYFQYALHQAKTRGLLTRFEMA